MIFLDFDGVLNTRKTSAHYWNADPADALDPDKVSRIGRFAETIDAAIVISSAWRESHSLDDLIGMLERRGFAQARARVIDVTPIYGSLSIRGQEIDSWLSTHAVDAFVIFDDLDSQYMSPVSGHHVETSIAVGLTDWHLIQARRVLTRKYQRMTVKGSESHDPEKLRQVSRPDASETA